jgi:hypothetical protein
MDYFLSEVLTTSSKTMLEALVSTEELGGKNNEGEVFSGGIYP